MGGVRGRSLREKLVTGGVGLKYVVWDRWFELWLRVEGCVVGGVCLAYVGEYLGGVVGLGRGGRA